MTALGEFQCQEVGEAFLALLQRTIGAVARAGLYPPPGGRDHWDADAVDTTVADFLASSQTPRRLTDLRTHCRTDQALRARLQRTIKNFLADGGRRTPVGRLVLRFNEVLGEEPDFERDGLYWRLAGTTSEPAVVDVETLVGVVAALEVTVPPAWRKGDRQGPEIDRSSVVRVACAALEAAGGPLRPADLAQLAARRLGLGAPPLSIDATAFDPAPAHAHPTDPTGAGALVDLRADEVFSRLNEAERAAIAPPHLPVEALGRSLGVSGSKAHLIRKRAVTILQDELGDEDDGQAVATAVFERARTWSESWMPPREPT
ncbi:MAG TPA: hypothetical protein VF228_13695 [Iamia sp.]